MIAHVFTIVAKQVLDAPVALHHVIGYVRDGVKMAVRTVVKVVAMQRAAGQIVKFILL